jgi:riboflavin transporter FmnP
MTERSQQSSNPVTPLNPVKPATSHTQHGARPQLKNTNRWSTRELVTIALLCALSILLSFVEVPLLPGVSWLSYNASIMPAAVCGFAYGPVAGVVCGTVSAFAHGILMGNFTGAVMNFLVVVGFVAPSALLYKKVHTLKGALAGLIMGIVVATAMAIVGNLIVTPFWLGVPFDAVVEMIIPILLPFNILKGLINTVLTLVVYKSISNLITPAKDRVKGR